MIISLLYIEPESPWSLSNHHYQSCLIFTIPRWVSANGGPSAANEKKQPGERRPPYVASFYCMWLVIPDSARRFESLTRVIQEPAGPTSTCSEDYTVKNMSCLDSHGLNILTRWPSSVWPTLPIWPKPPGTSWWEDILLVKSRIHGSS